MLDEFPSLEVAATAVALALCLRSLIMLSQPARLVGGSARIESSRARDLVGAAVLASAVVYAIRVGRASTWFLAACSVALLAHCLGFYLRARGRKQAASTGRAAPTAEQPLGRAPAADTQAVYEEGDDNDEEDDDDEDDDEAEADARVEACTRCGSPDLLELTDTARYLTGLAKLGPVNANVCRSCGALAGQLEQPELLQPGAEHGTTSRLASPSARRAQKPADPAT